MELRQSLAPVAVDQELRELEVGDDGSDLGLVRGSGADRRCDRERGGEEDRRGEERNGTPPVSRNAPRRRAEPDDRASTASAIRVPAGGELLLNGSVRGR